MDEYDVIVVGGGPTGMTVAGDLARAGRSVAVLDKHVGVNPTSRAFAVLPRTLELLDARDLADAVLATGARIGEVDLFGAAVLRLTRLRTAYPFALITPQVNVDGALAGYAEAHGADIVRSTEVTGLTQDADGVRLTTRSIVSGEEPPATGEVTRTWRASYVVAADGAHSTVRRLLGVDFPGREVLSSVVLADVRLAEGPSGGGLTVASTPMEFGFLAPYAEDADEEGRWFRTMLWDRRHQVPDSEPVAEAEVRAVLRAAYGHDFALSEVGWHTRFHCDERQVAAYRHGRVLLAGDAAHVHSPVGGQGMNTGIQDAANLAWKLDAALAGADRTVLDSYHTERHPIGRRVLLQSGTMLRAITLRPRVARWLRDRAAPLALDVPAIGTLVTGSFSGIGLRYGHGRGEHRLVGTDACAVPLVGDDLTVVQRGGDWVLVRATGEQAGDPVHRGLVQAERADAGPALLVRPDGYVAWAGASITDPGWAGVLERWRGPVGRDVSPA